MRHFVQRTCTVVRGIEGERGREGEPGRRGDPASRPVEAFREVPAYVLLGPPGSGKTEALRLEARREGGRYVAARDFLTFDPEPEWKGGTICIDGLDEVRAGTSDGRTPFDGIRARLRGMGSPRFRLSCREADWFGANDRERLKAVAPNGEVQVLRLDPLSDQGVLDILGRNRDEDDPAAFVAKARRRGVEGLLRNPQNLGMLVAAVGETEDEWPRTRAQTFDMACRKLVSEDNPEHQIALNGKADTESLLAAAGDLCALLLLAGKAGVTLPGTAPDTNHPRLDQIPGRNRQLLRLAAGTNLFAMPSAGPEGRLAPGHRQIAEHLAARHLAACIATGLPVGRVLSLMTGFDGGIVAECRGLAAWLAALSTGARADIVERDPLGVLLYGDAQPFGPGDKRLVFRALRREIHRNPRLAPYSSSGSPLRPLVGPDLEDQMRQALTDSARDEAHQSFVRLICEAIRDAAPRPGLGDSLMAVVRDASWPTHVRCDALGAYLRARQDDPRVSATLRELLDHVYTGAVPTRDDNLLGILLAELYPNELSVADVVNYLRQPDRRNPWTRYDRFWTKGLIEKSTVRRMVRLLDLLRVPMERVRSASGESPREVRRLVRPPIALLRHLLEHAPQSVSQEQIAYWLDFAAWVALNAGGRVGDAAFFRTWLSAHPATARRLRDDAPLVRLFDAGPGDADGDGDRPKGRQENPEARPDPSDGRFDELRNVFKKNESALRSNECRGDLLHTLATAYFNGFSDVVGQTPEERLQHLLGPDDDLLDAALAGLRGAIRRPDLPMWTEVSKLAAEGRTHYLARPFMAGLQELSAAAGTGDCRLGDSQARLALAIHFALPGMGQADDSRHPPRWLRDCVAREPDTVADVWSHCARGQLRRGETYLPDAGRLARDRDYAQLAQAASLPLLNAFPVRCRAAQLPILSSLLAAGVAHGSGTQLLGLIETKLTHGSMNSGQRVHWLAAGLLLQPGAYGDRLASYVSGNVRRVQRLAEMIREPAVLRALADRMDATVVETLIRLIGPYTTGPPDTDRAYRVTWPIQADETLHRFIDGLSEDASDAAGKALESLAEDDRLEKWRSRLLDRLHRQKSVRREAAFSHPRLDRVAEVLNNGRPANAADLAALALDGLRQLARRIRDVATSDWRQYWNVDKDNKAVKPKPENAGRDALLSDLERALTPLGVESVKEGAYADDKRADIRVSVPGCNVPIEIKRSCHDDWWSSIRTQLIAKYTRDPGTDGYGIYLVFWYGEAEGCGPVPASGRRPRSPGELQRALIDTLTGPERRKISVCVIDVSKPQA